MSSSEYTDRNYWERQARASAQGSWKARLLGKLPLSLYYDELLTILASYVDPEQHRSVLEIGCAPGNHLVLLCKSFQLEPFGVEYRSEGVAMTRDNLRKNGLESDGIFLSDFRDPGFQQANRARYDVVCSFGLIEHFEDTREAIDKHAALLKEGGVLVLNVPNLSYLNALLTPRKVLEAHNRSIMRLDALRRGAGEELSILHLEYQGGPFNAGLFRFTNRLLEALRTGFYCMQRLCVDPVLRILLRAGLSLRTKYTSPSLLLVCRKTSGSMKSQGSAARALPQIDLAPPGLL